MQGEECFDLGFRIGGLESIGDNSDSLNECLRETLQMAVRALGERHKYSAAESLIARDIALGYRRGEMAKRRRRSERTIQSQIRTLLMKTGVRDTGALRGRILGIALVIALSRNAEGDVLQRAATSSQ